LHYGHISIDYPPGFSAISGGLLERGEISAFEFCVQRSDRARLTLQNLTLYCRQMLWDGQPVANRFSGASSVTGEVFILLRGVVAPFLRGVFS
jgi:hypothetical protein